MFGLYCFDARTVLPEGEDTNRDRTKSLTLFSGDAERAGENGLANGAKGVKGAKPVLGVFGGVASRPLFCVKLWLRSLAKPEEEWL